MSSGLRLYDFAFARLSAYCFIRDFALASASLVVLWDFNASLFSGRVVLIFLSKNAVAGGSLLARRHSGVICLVLKTCVLSKRFKFGALERRSIV